MKYGKLRIAWSVVWGLLAMLLLVLWGRSYWYADDIMGRYPNADFRAIESARGILHSLSVGACQGQGAWRYFNERIRDEAPDNEFWPIGYFVDPSSANFYIAHWLIALPVLAVAVAPWLTTKRFSLRTLLIATTLVAVVLGLVMWAKG